MASKKGGGSTSNGEIDILKFDANNQSKLCITPGFYQKYWCSQLRCTFCIMGQRLNEYSKLKLLGVGVMKRKEVFCL
jgi:hypothetical protein